jgi:hypothetical protein
MFEVCYLLVEVEVKWGRGRFGLKEPDGRRPVRPRDNAEAL